MLNKQNDSETKTVSVRIHNDQQSIAVAHYYASKTRSLLRSSHSHHVDNTHAHTQDSDNGTEWK